MNFDDLKNNSMTFSANRNNVKPTFWLITWMMILLCLIATEITLQSVNSSHLASLNSVIYSIFGFSSIWVARFKTSSSCSIFNFAILSLLIVLLVAFLVCFAFFALRIIFLIDFSTNNTFRMITIFAIFMFVKFRKWFDLLAFRTSFCLNWFSHSLFLYKRLRLEPVAAHTVVGSAYFN